jgi:hypothetical protein
MLSASGLVNAQNLSRPPLQAHPQSALATLDSQKSKASDQNPFPRADTPPGDAPLESSIPPLAKRENDEEFETSAPVLASQDALLHPGISQQKSVESIIDLRVLREPSPYRNIAVNANTRTPNSPNHEPTAEQLQNELAHLSALYRESGKSENSSDCPVVALSIEQHIQLDPSLILEIVDKEIRANPACACEITKSAIIASEAQIPLVVDIVETAIASSPEHMRIISQCAIASLPEATAAIQILLSKLDPGRKISRSSKDSKDAKDAGNDEADESNEQYLDPNQDPNNMVSAGPPNPLNQISDFPALNPTTPPPTAISPPSITAVDPITGTPTVVSSPNRPRRPR